MCLGGGDGDIHCSNMRILYVEDHAETRDPVSYVLTGANYEVARGKSGASHTSRADSILRFVPWCWQSTHTQIRREFHLGRLTLPQREFTARLFEVSLAGET